MRANSPRMVSALDSASGSSEGRVKFFPVARRCCAAAKRFNAFADPFKIAGNLHRRDDLAQIRRHRLAQSQHPDNELLRLPLQPVHLGILLDRAGPRRRISLHDRPGCQLKLALNETPHFAEAAAQGFQLLVEALDEVPRRVGHASPLSDQPKRPVMYSWVRRSRGAVNICAAVPTSINSPPAASAGGSRHRRPSATGSVR